MAVTSNERSALAAEISEHKHEIASYATDQTLKAAYWDLRYGEMGRVSCFNDNLKNIEVFSLAVRNNSPMIAETHVLWLRDLHINLGMCTTFVAQAFTHMQTAAAEILSPDAASALKLVLDRSKNAMVYTDPLCREITKHQDAIVEVVVNAMYTSIPYWRVRYGDTGRAACGIDTYYNVNYLVDALGRDNTKGILIHTAWMRDFLISRGMCSEYYITAWSVLADAIVAVIPVQYHDRIRKLVQLVIDNMRYKADFEGLILNQRDTILDQVAARVYDGSPGLKLRFTRHDYSQDMHYRLSYLVDAVCQDQREIITDYLNWTRGVLPHLSLTLSEFDAGLAALA
ncbi:MAG: hypothetical protein GYB67_12105, partial [Chloroflexi bacterium]|nr:hypothetical protein [Chloroflexota bacterium]